MNAKNTIVVSLPPSGDVAAAKACLDKVLDKLAALGFEIWGCDDGSIVLADKDYRRQEFCESRLAK